MKQLDADAVRRREDGSIDTDFYAKQAITLRQKARGEAFTPKSLTYLFRGLVSVLGNLSNSAKDLQDRAV